MDFDKAINLIKKFKKDRYLFGENVLKDTGKVSCRCGNTAAIFRTTFKGSDKYIEIITDSLIKSGVRAVAIEKGSAPNAPREDLVRITEKINQLNPDMLISFGGGSTIDAVKAANVLYCLGGSIDEYFGAGIVSTRLKNQKKKLLCNIAVQTLAGSGAHLTKYSNITDTAACQKKLIIDDAIVPDYAIFDYSLTYNTPSDITCDGALDGLSHLIEVLFSLENKKGYKEIYDIASSGIELIVKYLPAIIEEPGNITARNGLCYATDLGGYAIMTGGTNGPHLASFSMIDILSHGRACAILIPYYTVFFSPRVEKSLMLIGEIFKKYGYIKQRLENLNAVGLGKLVAKAIIDFEKNIGFPSFLGEIKGFDQGHIEKALLAAKDPGLESKLQNMPVALDTGNAEKYLRPVLEAAKEGNLEIVNIKND